jgi:hypothetical protein
MVFKLPSFDCFHSLPSCGANSRAYSSGSLDTDRFSEESFSVRYAEDTHPREFNSLAGILES